ncbi:SRPBCC domain-containing protein [Parahalioglobus pacificus]|uniref:Activator of Hsp90 ATPase homologue 1/2-like C-terminal domain-containing protein n=1 Tax=Parahalioglobus pacificus TaxID=930806 RepID=A0A919CIZ7_9GAMM|nr:SRPBCC domain-containing protein [Halioglobus pacificus]GHD27297.1 hypothetical protein GCM10007053_05360 [Halioglobus pacificus]
MITDSTVSSDEILIHAPIKLVWEILVDFGNYRAWNDFCPKCEAELTLGSPITMQVDLGFGLQEQVEYICRIEPPRAIAWKMNTQPGDPVHALRTQTLEAVDDATTRYVSIDEFSGEGVPMMMETLGAAVETGFNQCGYGLKKYSEQRYAAQAAEGSAKTSEGEKQ